MSSLKTTAEQISTNKANGIYFCGVVSQRRKRMVPKDNPTATVVTYEFTDEATNVTYYVDDFEPDSFLEQGQYVEVPVRVKAYVNKSTNRPAFSLTIKKPTAKKTMIWEKCSKSNEEVLLSPLHLIVGRTCEVSD